MAKKLRKLLEMRVDTPAITAALTDISTFYESNTISNRRGLRAELERRGVPPPACLMRTPTLPPALILVLVPVDCRCGTHC